MIEMLMYSKNDCGFCDYARAVLKAKNIAFTEKKLGIDYNRDELRLLLTAHEYPEEKQLTVPQFFVGEKYIGDSAGLKKFLGFTDEQL